MKTSLVTGGAGFIGSHVAHDLIKQGHHVVILDDLSGGFIDNIPKEAEFINGSILDHVLLGKIFDRYNFNYVYHFAAYAAEGLSHFIKRFNYQNNLIGSVNLINESVNHKIECFVFTSSIAVYGSAKPPMEEDLTPEPEDPYAIAKCAVEQELKVTKEMFGLDYIIFRPHNVYGEHQNLGDKYRNVIGIFINQILQGSRLTVFGDGNQTRAFSYIGDLSPTIAKSVSVPKAKNQIFNIGADKEYSINDLATSIKKTMNSQAEIRYVEARNEVLHAYADHSKLNKIFGLSETTSLEEGLGKMTKWAQSVGIQSSTRFKDIEVEENLPSIWRE